MIRLIQSLNAWGSAEFAGTLKRELEQLAADQLPLQQGLARGSHVAEAPFKVMIIGVVEEADVLRARVGVLYSGIIAGCSCADDPTPVDTHSEYCELRLVIDRRTAEATVTLSDGAPESD